MIYNKLCDFLMEYLGNDNFNILYNNNLDFEWDDLLSVEDNASKPILGVLRVESAVNNYQADLVIRTEQIKVSFAIENDREVLNNAIGNINALCNDPETYSISDSTNVAFIQVGSRSDGQLINVDVNGETKEMFITDLALLITIHDNLSLASDIAIEVNGSPLKNIVSAVWQTNKTVEGNIYNGSINADNTATMLQHQLVVTVTASSTNTVLTTLMNEEDQLKNYTIYYNDTLKIRSYTMQMLTISETAVVGGFITAVLTFVDGCNHY